MKFKGTIIITDPCYIISGDDYVRTEYGSKLDMLGFTTYLVEDTGFGDWMNAIIDSKGNTLGEFCADSGQVCVVLADELAAYSPRFSNPRALLPNCYVVIYDFDGDIEIDTSDIDWTVIHGSGNINFHSLAKDEVCE